MKVILTEDVKGTGKRGETIEVRDGYGRNFLIPRGLAVGATGGNLSRFENIVKGIAKKREREIKAAEDVKTRLDEATLTIKKKVGAEGKLFGSVTDKDVVDAIKAALGVDIDKKDVRMDEPIKNTGAHTVEIHLSRNVNATVKIEVEEEH
jgi:large subunit ribosomal protein L9